MWKIIKETPFYSINDLGEVKRNEYTRTDKIGRKTLVKEKPLKQYLDKDNYYRVMLITGLSKPRYVLVHRLVAEAFIPNNKNYKIVNHKNENKQDNRVNNLEWCTIEYNNNYGKRNENAKNTLIQKYGKKIIAIKDNKQIIFNSVGEASRKLQINTSNIFNCLRGIINTTGGYKFKEYESEVV